MQELWGKIKHYKKWGIVLLVLVLAAIGATTYIKKNDKPVSTETTVIAERGDIQATVAATGTISAVNSVEIGSRVTGLITEVRVQENDKVKAGQVLLVLDDSTMRAQVAQYQAQVTNYAAIYERSKQLTAVGGMSVQQLDTDRTNYLVAQANYNNFASQLDYYIIKAPIDGMVIGKPTPAGQTVVQGMNAAQVVMTIADMSRMEIKVMVDETDIGKVKAGQKVSFTVDAHQDITFTGKVRSISKDATTTSNVVYYPVYVDVDDARDLLYPTMTARVTIQVGESEDTVLVPLAAVKENNGQKYVELMVAGKTQSTLVTMGLSDDEKAEIINGVSEGDQVVVPSAKAKTATTTQNQGGPPPI